MLLIDDRLPPPPPRQPDRPVWDPDWRTVAWVVATLVFAVGAGVTSAFVSYVLLCVAVGCGGQAIARVLPSTFGLREYRQ
jgi:hypothetical protein